MAVEMMVKKHKESIILLAKKKYNENMATGGGPVGKITLAEEIVLEFLKDKPQLIGIPGGIESGVIEPVEDAASVADLVVQQAPSRRKCMDRIELTEELHDLESCKDNRYGMNCLADSRPGHAMSLCNYDVMRSGCKKLKAAQYRQERGGSGLLLIVAVPITQPTPSRLLGLFNRAVHCDLLQRCHTP
ncbi:hypothetical protein MAR_026652 [Mya arenaria]|uniref:Uncharacterized protein n=1 Tax=Mya arenaria TaxID=6604 RepID=A0ABY7ER57_MYAAR|nr:hypothetical protein MAR_026652 [Mya arenaria]